MGISKLKIKTMKKLNLIRTLMGGLIIASMFLGTSCQKEKITYQLKVRNSCENQLLGFPFMKYDIKELNVGDKKFENIPAGSESDYLDIQSDTDYPVSITYDTYFYNTDNFVYEYDNTYTVDMGTESWTSEEESNKFVMVVEIGDLLQAYDPVYEVYFIE